jgi:hypothetical protein
MNSANNKVIFFIGSFYYRLNTLYCWKQYTAILQKTIAKIDIWLALFYFCNVNIECKFVYVKKRSIA